jgi:DNA-directed RNA polymerase specialized sigma24 family protein
MLGVRKIANQEATLYATGEDFCRIFQRDMNRLYLLSFLLTADHALAEKCFVRGFDDTAKTNPVFKEWAESWARRTIIQSAIQMIAPKSADRAATSSISDGKLGHAMTEPAAIAAVVDLPAFERFVFVMTALEGYSEQECSLLLNCSRGEVAAARTRALQRIGRSGGADRKLADNSRSSEGRDDLRPALPLEPVSQLAASA